MSLVTETIFGQILESNRNLNNSETGGDRQEKYEDQKQRLGLSRKTNKISWSGIYLVFLQNCTNHCEKLDRLLPPCKSFMK